MSGLTGQPAREEDFRSAAYWAAQARQPVRYAAAVAAAYDLGGRLFIEAGPDGTLSALGPDCLPGQPGAPGAQDGQDGAGGQAGSGGLGGAGGQASAAVPGGPGGPAEFVALQHPGRPGAGQFVSALARVHAHGAKVDWAAVLAGQDGRLVDLPTYAFQRERYWLTAGPAAEAKGLVPGGSAGEERFWAAVEGQDRDQVAAALGTGADEVAAVLPALAAWRRRERDSAAADGWRYRVAWEPVTGLPAAVLAGTWLAVLPQDDPGGTAAAWAQALAGHGARVVTVTADAAAGREELAALVRQALAGHGREAQVREPARPGTAPLRCGCRREDWRGDRPLVPAWSGADAGAGAGAGGARGRGARPGSVAPGRRARRPGWCAARAG